MANLWLYIHLSIPLFSRVTPGGLDFNVLSCFNQYSFVCVVQYDVEALQSVTQSLYHVAGGCAVSCV